MFGITLSEIGGAQKVVYDIISSISSDNYAITLLTSPNGELIEWIENLNKNIKPKINIIEISSLKREISPIFDLISFIRIFRIMINEKFDIVHLHSSKMGILGRFAAFLNKVPNIIFTVHSWGINEYQGYLKRKLFSFIEVLCNKICDTTICVSQDVLEKGLKNGWIEHENSIVIHNGIRTEKIYKGKLKEEINSKNDLIIGTVMRLREPKMPLFTIEAFYNISKKLEKAKLVIIGDGPIRTDCEKLISQLDIRDKVFITGTRDNVRELINDFDVFTLFSKWEGLPISILEAMFAEIPVVASKIGGIPEMIQNDKNGFLLKELNVEKASDLIYRLLIDKEMRESFGKYSKELVNSKFDIDKMIEKYQNIYLKQNPNNSFVGRINYE